LAASTAGAAAGAAASSFLPQAVRAMAASRLASRTVFFMVIPQDVDENKKLNQP
jgi:hypothetical protein